MRVAVVYFSQEVQGKLAAIAKAYGEGLSGQGHDVVVINGLKDEANLFIYDYLVLGAEPVSVFSGRIDNSVQHCLKNLGQIDGKVAYAFLLRKGLWAFRSLQLWMRWLESCGLMLMLSDIVVRPSEARLFGRRLNIYH
ncbi:hypothetical protein P0082_08000 [Candidatus Haliotispira prima]|uniref:Glycosyltransferase n=1 Tax=Candidatus Haliotispira prima TaxID=3034016 RepID=A0ABY8MEM0_9SPIO|nr:hypothetical protein P0082_08000 [Candidatus Haliotispira prima]